MTELSLEERATNYETMVHIYHVQELLLKCAADLHDRCLTHDQSKLRPPEVDTFTKYTPRLKEAEYGSDLYKQFLAEMKPALDHHYQNNSHHPEHHEDGVLGMTLIDVLEMLLDWIASTRRTKNGNIYKSITIQQQRFGIDDQLAQLMRNTVKALCPEIEEP